MKFFQKRGVAIAVLILAIIASGAWGLHKAPAVSTPEGGEKLDPSLSTAAFTQYVRDDADVLSDKTEEAIGLYNANWDKMFGSIMAVVTTESANDIENAAYDYAIEMQLAENDAILVIAKQQQDYYLLASGNFYDLLSRLSQSFVASCMADNVQKGDYDAAVRSLCAALHVELSQQYQQSEAALDEAANGVMFIMILVIFFIIWIMLDGMRYRRYRRRYMMPGMGVPTVVDAISLFRQAELELDVPRGVLVTMQDVDTRVREMGRLVGYSCDLALHRGLSLGEIPAFLS